MQYFKNQASKFHHHRTEPEFSSVMKDVCILKEALCLERLWGVKFSRDISTQRLQEGYFKKKKNPPITAETL